MAEQRTAIEADFARRHTAAGTIMTERAADFTRREWGPTGGLGRGRRAASGHADNIFGA